MSRRLSYNANVIADDERFIDLLFERRPQVPATLALIAGCVLVFALCALLSGALVDIPTPVLVKLGANFAPQVQQGEAWRLVSAMFLHGGIVHLGFNMLALWQAGRIIERLFGTTAFALIYLGSGVLGALASLWWQPGAVSVGASGAVFGVYGALLAYLLRLRGSVPTGLFSRMRSATVAFVGFSLFAGFSLPGIDNAAHVGGLLGGLLLGVGWARPLLASAPRRGAQWLLPGLATLMALGAGALVWYAAPQVGRSYANHIAFERAIRNFALADARLGRSTEQVLTQVQRRQGDPAQLAAQLRAELLPAWDAALAELARQQVASGDAERHQVLLQYGRMRRQAVAELARGLAEGDARALDRAANFNLAAQNLLLQLRLREAMEAARRGR